MKGFGSAPDEAGMRADATPWPVLARLTCGHFRAYNLADSPRLHQGAFCHFCNAEGKPALKHVEAAVSVADLVRLFDVEAGGA